LFARFYSRVDRSEILGFFFGNYFMQTTAQSLGSLLKSARDIMRKDKGLNGDLDRLPMLTWIMRWARAILGRNFDGHTNFCDKTFPRP
jgi:hypothetical protein